MPRLYDFRLANPTFEITPFQAVAYDEEPIPVNILSDSVDTLKKEHVEAQKSFDDVQTLFGKTTAQLYQDDPATLEWWSQYKDGINYEINAYLNSGDYSGAIRAASKFGAKAASDPEVLGRINSSSAYKAVHDDAVNRMNEGKGRVRDTDLEWFETVDPYKHEDIKDKNGNIIGGTWKQKVVLYDNVNWADIYSAAYKLINPDSKSTSTSSGSRRSNSGPEGSYSKGSSSSRSHNKTVVTQQEINDMAQEIAKDTSIMPAVSQQYLKDKFRYMVLSNKYWSEGLNASDRDSIGYEMKQLKSRIFDKNGNTDEEGYIKRCLTNQIISEGLAYENESTSTTNESDISTAKPDGSGGGGGTAPVIVNVGNQDSYNVEPDGSGYPAPRIREPNNKSKTTFGKFIDKAKSFYKGLTK